MGKLTLRIEVEPPGWWKAENPDECIQKHTGESYGHSCVASEKWRREAAELLRRLVRYVEDNLW